MATEKLSPLDRLLEEWNKNVGHINWVKFAIAWCILGTAASLYEIARGDVTFSRVGSLMIMHIVFAVVFLVLYPYRRAKSG